MDDPRQKAAAALRATPSAWGVISEELPKWWREEGARKGQVTLPDVAGAVIGETPGEMLLNVGMGVPGKIAKAATLGAAALTNAPDAEAILPGSRQAMLSARQKIVKMLREQSPANLLEPGAKDLSPVAAQARAWVGGGDVTGLRAQPKLMLQMFEDEIKRLAARDNITPAQAIRGIAQGKTY